MIAEHPDQDGMHMELHVLWPGSTMKRDHVRILDQRMLLYGVGGCAAQALRVHPLPWSPPASPWRMAWTCT